MPIKSDLASKQPASKQQQQQQQQQEELNTLAAGPLGLRIRSVVATVPPSWYETEDLYFSLLLSKR
jgi:hypothetical protein